MSMSRGSRAVRWFLRRPSRIGVAAAVLAVVAVAVFGQAFVSCSSSARSTQEVRAQQSTCQGAIAGWAGDFFGPDRRRDWPERVARWVDPQIRQGVTAIPADSVPVGRVDVEAVADGAPLCDAWLNISPVDGSGPSRIRVTAQKGMTSGVWLVSSWEPADNPESEPDGSGS